MEQQEKRADRRGKDEEEGKQGVISLFVENLPESLHWKGLWFAFARYGEVVNVYIARKRSRGGKRFGFFRMENMGDANRTIQRLNGFALYGSRLVVKIARDIQGWKRSTTGRSQSFEPKQTENGKNVDVVVQKMVETANGRVDNTADIINGEEKLADQKGGNNVCLAGSGNEEMDGNSDQELNKSARREASPRKKYVSQSGPKLSGGRV
ncbi:hypothetical protein V6N11_081217 [Hibiscus sabdariffa]|uniref:RRM domain-containing protein n=1 Tax=Hibiscus sabdariffa TaxID=183260 RepID=A0ABR2QJN4_9ROSI